MKKSVCVLACLPLVAMAGSIKEIRVSLTNDSNVPMYYETLTIGQDTRIAAYPPAIVQPRKHVHEAVVVQSASGKTSRTLMSYRFDLPPELCQTGDGCSETVELLWQANMGPEDAIESHICGAMETKHVDAFCLLPYENPNQPGVLEIEFIFHAQQ